MIGNILLTLALFSSVFSIIMYLLTYKGNNKALNLARIGYHVSTISVLGASTFLMFAILNHHYEFRYIYNYSNSDLSLGMLMSTFYAGQEGSFMLWLLFTALAGIALLEYTSKKGKDLESRVMMIYTLTLAFLLILVSSGLKSPFEYIWTTPTYITLGSINSKFLSLPFIKEFFFTDQTNGTHLILMNKKLADLLANNGISLNEFIIYGRGLNPLLNNFWMQIHPPLLFVGFAMSTVPFAFAFASLIKNDYREWIIPSLPWLSAAMMILGLAIMLGGYWSYIILGWGGYWGWDPVENSSLVPWIIGVAGIHTMLIQKHTQKNGGAGRFIKTNLILSILTYLLVLYSTFLTRSGVLGDASVHSFVSPGKVVYFFLLMFIISFTLLGFGAVAYRWKYLEKTFSAEENFLSRELALFTGTVVLIGSAIIIIAGTSAPLFGSSVDVSFYNRMNLPVAIIIGFLNGLSLFLSWKSTNEKTLAKRLTVPVIITVIFTIITVLLAKISDIMAVILLASAYFTIAANLIAAYNVIKKSAIKLGAYVSHIGFAIFILGVLASAWFTKEAQVDLTLGEPKNVFGYNLTFTGYRIIENGKKFAFDVEIEDGNSRKRLTPVMYYSDYNKSLMRDPDILNLITKDLYIAPVSYEDAKTVAGNNITEFILSKNESVKFNNCKITFLRFDFSKDAMNSMQAGKDFYIGAVLKVEKNEDEYFVAPKMRSSNMRHDFESVLLEEINLKIDLINLDATGKIKIAVSENNNSDYAETKKAVFHTEVSIKPYMNLIWSGTIIMFLGFFIAVIRRSRLTSY